MREANQQLLTTCDAVILFTEPGDAWKRTVDNELKNAGLPGGNPCWPPTPTWLIPRPVIKKTSSIWKKPNLINGERLFRGGDGRVYADHDTPGVTS